MKIDSLIEIKENQLNSENFIQFSDEQLKSFTNEDMQKIVTHFHGHTLMKLPVAEIDFFEWLKKNDNAVWNDIWGDHENEYLVSIDFLSHFSEGKNGFPICDLVDTPNYYFTVKHIKPDGLERMQEVLNKIENGEKLDIDELLMYDLHIAAVDIWHFCYNYNLPLIEVKELISEMVYKGYLVHLTDREDLLRYIEV